MIIKRIIKSNSSFNGEIDYIKHSKRYNQKSTTEETVIKFRKKT